MSLKELYTAKHNFFPIFRAAFVFQVGKNDASFEPNYESTHFGGIFITIKVLHS